MKTIGEPISVTLYLGGMCGPEGSISHESFNRRRKMGTTQTVKGPIPGWGKAPFPRCPNSSHAYSSPTPPQADPQAANTNTSCGP